MADHRLVIQLDDNHILQTNRVNLTRRSIIYKNILTPQTYMTSHTTNTLGVKWKERAVLLPVTHIIPAKIGGNNHNMVRLLQYPIINRNRCQGRPQFIKCSTFLRGTYNLGNDIYFLG